MTEVRLSAYLTNDFEDRQIPYFWAEVTLSCGTHIRRPGSKRGAKQVMCLAVFTWVSHFATTCMSHVGWHRFSVKWVFFVLCGVCVGFAFLFGWLLMSWRARCCNEVQVECLLATISIHEIRMACVSKAKPISWITVKHAEWTSVLWRLAL